MDQKAPVHSELYRLKAPKNIELRMRQMMRRYSPAAGAKASNGAM